MTNPAQTGAVADHHEIEMRLRVRQVRWEAENVLSLLLEPLDGGLLPAWAAGAHVDLRLPGSLTRQYSLCGSPRVRSSWQVAVLREAGGRGGSEAVHTSLRPGDVVDVVGPRNNFRLEDAASYIFIAGGIGITPIVPMIETVEAAGASWHLTYGGRSRTSMAFADVLSERFDVKVDIVPEDERGMPDLAALLAEPRGDTLIYCCGPEALLSAVESACTAWPEDSLHLERFRARPPEDRDRSNEASFELVLRRSNTVMTVPPATSVLAALEMNGVEVPNSCREGICGTCETTVVSGIPDHRDSLLSPDERRANDTMMICVGRALSPRLELDL